MIAALARAKVNLYLHVGAPGADGYHPLSSLAAFADLGDGLTLEPAEAFAFTVGGPFAHALQGEGENLAVRAVRALAEAAGRPMPAVRLSLRKELPVAAGLGGGTSDAAAALRLLQTHIWPDVSEADLAAVMEGLAADGPMCLRGRPVIAEGRGERLSPAPAFPYLPAVLVNPGVACPTPEIFRAYDAAGRFGGAARGALQAAYPSAAALAADLAKCRNDLEPVARAGRPAVGEALDLLGAQPEGLLTRLSGSGATGFALCADAGAARRLADRLAGLRPQWWVRACTLGGSTP